MHLLILKYFERDYKTLYYAIIILYCTVILYFGNAHSHSLCENRVIRDIDATQLMF